MKEIKAIIQPFMLDEVLHALQALDELPGLTVSQVIGWGKTRARSAHAQVSLCGHAFAKKTKVEIVVTDERAEEVAGVIARAAKTGKPGDGKIFLIDVADVIKVRTGERGSAAL